MLLNLEERNALADTCTLLSSMPAAVTVVAVTVIAGIETTGIIGDVDTAIVGGEK